MKELTSSLSNKDTFNEKSAALYSQLMSSQDTTAEEVKNNKDPIRQQLARFQQKTMDGFELFIARDHHGATTEISEKLILFVEKLVDSDAQPELPQLSDEEFDALFNIAIDACEDKDFNAADSMMTTLISLFPNRVQPYIALAKIAIEQQGTTAGLKVFDNLTHALKDPLLYYYSAMAHVDDGNPSSIRKAEDLLKEAILMCSKDPDNFGPLQNEIQEYLIGLA